MPLFEGQPANGSIRCRRPDDATLRKRLEELAAERRRFGFRRLTVLLRREGVKDNVKRILRVYRESNLQVRRRVKRRVALGRANPAPVVAKINERWSLYFVHDTLRAGRKIRTLNIVDDFTRECLAIEVDTSLSGNRVARVLDAIAEVRGYSETIVMDNGTELTSLAMLAWARDRNVRLHYIAPTASSPGPTDARGVCPVKRTNYPFASKSGITLGYPSTVISIAVKSRIRPIG